MPRPLALPPLAMKELLVKTQQKYVAPSSWVDELLQLQLSLCSHRLPNCQLHQLEDMPLIRKVMLLLLLSLLLAS